MPERGEEESSFIGKFKQFYYKLEDGYYAFLDKLHESGIDLYKYFVEPIESRGIPSFPVATALILVIAGGLFFAFAGGFGPTGTLRVSVAGAPDGLPVTLLIEGNEFATRPTASESALFTGVPLNKQAKIRINDPRFAPVLQDVSLTSSDNAASISLSTRGEITQDFLVNVVDASTGAPIRDASISFESLSTGVLGSATTQPDGTAVLSLDNLDTILSLDISADNFESTQRSVLAREGQLTIQLMRVSGDLQAGGENPVRGDLLVSVSDNLGQAISARVDVFVEGSSTPIASDNVESGTAFFDQVAPVGTALYAVATPVSEEFLQGRTTAAELPAEGLELSLSLQRVSTATSQNIVIRVESGSPVEFAAVSLFSANTNQLITSGVTDSSGAASFTIASEIELSEVYVAINAEGYLPFISSLSTRESVFELEPLAAGNNAEFDAEVLDPDAFPLPGARVELADASGRLFGIHEFTGPSGRASFTGVPVDASLRLFAFSDGATGQSDVFEVSFAESGEKFVTVIMQRSTGTFLVSAKDLVANTPVPGAFIEAFADSPVGISVANCTTGTDGACFLEKAWANRDIFIIASANGFESGTPAAHFVSPRQTKIVNVFLLSSEFREQTVINLVSLTDDDGNEIIDFPAIERGRVYAARFAASFPNASQRQGVFLRVGDEPTAAADSFVIKSFEHTPSNIGQPFSVHSTTYSPGPDCSVDLLNSDINNEGKKWVEVNYAGVSGVVELVARIFVKPTADPSDKLAMHYRAFAVQAGKYSRNPFDNELQLERKTPSKDECYADSITRAFDLVQGTSVCNEQGTACVDVSFSSAQQPEPVSSPFTATINREFNVHFEIRSFGSVEGASAFGRIYSQGPLRFSQYAGPGVGSASEDGKSMRVLLGEAAETYRGSVKAVGVIPTDYSQIGAEFGDARGVIASNQRGFVVVQGTGALDVSHTPSEFEVGKSKDLRLTIRTTAGEPITDATIEFNEENGSPFDGDVPPQIAGDNTPGNGENGQYTIRRVRPVAPGTFIITVSRDGFVPATRSLTSRISNFFEFDQPDFVSLSCNSTTLRVRNTLDVEVNADIYVDPACVSLSGPGITPVKIEGGQLGNARYRIPNFKPGRTRLIQLSPNSNASCQVELSALDPRTGSRSLDAPIQIENTCRTSQTTSFANADGIIYINNNVFQPPRLLVDTFSFMRYGSFQPMNYWDQRYFDAASYASPPMGGYNNFYQRAGIVDPLTGMPRQQFVDPRFAEQYSATFPGSQIAGQQLLPFGQQFGAQQPVPFGAVGVPREAAFGGQYGRAGIPDQFGGGQFFDIRRASFQSNWTIAWVNQDNIPHSFKCTDRAGNVVVEAELESQATHTQLVTRPGLYTCKLENANKGTIKIKSMCPKKGALYYTRLITRCMARKAIGDSGIFDGGKQHAAKIAASTKTRFVAFGGQFQVGQTDKETEVSCSGSTGGATCTLKITPLVPRNGFGFAIEDATGQPDYLIRFKATGNIDRSCFTFDQLDKISSFRSILQPVVSGISAIGLTSAPRFASFAIKFNEKGNCAKLRPTDTGSGRINFEPLVWNPSKNQFIPKAQEAFAVFELQSNANPNVKYEVKLVIQPTELLDGRYLFTAVPTTVGENKLFYRTSTDGDPREPGFVLNNLPDERVFLLPAPGQGTPIESKPGTIGVLDGNEPVVGQKLSSLSQLEKGFYLCSESGGCAPEQGEAKKLKPFEAVKKDDATQLGDKLGDVIGNYKFESAPTQVDAKDQPFICSGVNYCTSAAEQTAVDLAQREIEEQLKKQYAYVETFDLDSSMDNTQDALAGCIQEAMAEIVAQEAQYQMCKTLADFCGGVQYMDPEVEEVEEGESFASGITLDAVLGDSKTIVKDIICQETEAGQNLQALRACLQPGNRACRDRIASRIAGNLRQAQIKSVAREIPVVDIQQPVINLVTKRIQDNPRLAEASIAEGLATGGYNVYRFTVDPAKLIGEQGDKAREQGEVIFEVRPPGWDFSRAIAEASTAIAAVAFAPLRAPEFIYNWASSTAASPEDVGRVTLGFPFVVKKGDRTNVEFDKFQPTLLTMNKYPIMRAVGSTAREAKTDKSAPLVAGNACTVENRPVDPLALFDACEELRSDQEAYDGKLTKDKAPFARSLVFQAVPGKRTADPLQPVWPAEYSQPFEVTIPPKYEFRSSGATTAGISAPLIASIPGIGRALYPEASIPEKFKKLEIPVSDIKRYAVQVTSCKYTRDVANNVVLETMHNNCNPLQWPAGMLFQGSRASALSLTINNKRETCDGLQACIALKLDGNHLRVAVIDGKKNGAASAKLKWSKDPSGISLAPLARDLLRYYTDESYSPERLLDVLQNSENDCEVKADPTAVLIRCGVSADETAPFVFLSSTYGKTFTPAGQAARQLSINGQNVEGFAANEEPIVLVQTRDSLTNKCFASAGKSNDCTHNFDVLSNAVATQVTQQGMALQVPEQKAYLLAAFLVGNSGVSRVVGFHKQGNVVVKDFELRQGIALSAGSNSRIANATLFKIQSAANTAGLPDYVAEDLADVAPGGETRFDESTAGFIRFSTVDKDQSDLRRGDVTILFNIKIYKFEFNYGAGIAQQLQEAFSLADRHGLLNLRNALADSAQNTDITVECSVAGQMRRFKVLEGKPFQFEYDAATGNHKITPVELQDGNYPFAGDLQSCTATINAGRLGTYNASASPVNDTLVFNFGTSAPPRGAAPRGGFGRACTASLKPVLVPEIGGHAIDYVATLQGVDVSSLAGTTAEYDSLVDPAQKGIRAVQVSGNTATFEVPGVPQHVAGTDGGIPAFAFSINRGATRVCEGSLEPPVLPAFAFDPVTNSFTGNLPRQPNRVAVYHSSGTYVENVHSVTRTGNAYSLAQGVTLQSGTVFIVVPESFQSEVIGKAVIP